MKLFPRELVVYFQFSDLRKTFSCRESYWSVRKSHSSKKPRRYSGWNDLPALPPASSTLHPPQSAPGLPREIRNYRRHLPHRSPSRLVPPWRRSFLSVGAHEVLRRLPFFPC